ncbi:MAG: cupin domain-containing protein [Pseudomonadales bacterium]
MTHLSVSNALQKLGKVSDPFAELFTHGSLSIEIYKPVNKDLQQPHSRDEVYVIASGKGWFVNDTKRDAFETGDVLFVAAGVPHRFESFSDDFSTWVLFYGPEGGEQKTQQEHSS